MPVHAEPESAVDEPPIDDDLSAIAGVELFSGRLLAEFYAERAHRNAWDSDRARAFLSLARRSRADGFDPEDFHAAAVAQILASDRLDAEAESERTAADILLSDALLRYVHHYRFGKYNPRHINPGSIFVDKADAEGLKADMALVLASSDLDAELAALLPSPPFYRNLKRGYARYLQIADSGSWQDIPGGVNLTVGMVDPRVALIRERLAVTDGYRSAAGEQPDRYDEHLAEAVRAFQERSGLSPDGVVGPNTLRALNHPLEDRLLTIRANLERMRWLYNDMPSDYLLVDIAAFRLQLMRDHEPVWGTRVVVGTKEDQTPMFRDEMEYLVFNPEWSVPASIQKKMRGVSSRYKIIDRRTGRRVSGVNVSDHRRYRLVQSAGPKNALGRVKFIFPNGHAIYLHDTPSRHLFARSTRTYSHGCVRVKDPLTLAEQILGPSGWDQGEIERVVRRGKTRYVHLDDHLPVLLYYLTAFADEEGRVGFRRDVYGRDRPLLAALDQPAHRDRIAFREPEPKTEGEDEPAAESEPVVEQEASPQTAAASVTTPGADTPSPGLDLSYGTLDLFQAGGFGIREAGTDPVPADRATDIAALQWDRHPLLTGSEGPPRGNGAASRSGLPASGPVFTVGGDEPVAITEKTPAGPPPLLSPQGEASALSATLAQDRAELTRR
jgi:murein L,D-transpeptidase YcbB/YkuD